MTIREFSNAMQRNNFSLGSIDIFSIYFESSSKSTKAKIEVNLNRNDNTIESFFISCAPIEEVNNISLNSYEDYKRKWEESTRRIDEAIEFLNSLKNKRETIQLTS